jgi:hypothetical protein
LHHLGRGDRQERQRLDVLIDGAALGRGGITDISSATTRHHCKQKSWQYGSHASGNSKREASTMRSNFH